MSCARPRLMRFLDPALRTELIGQLVALGVAVVPSAWPPDRPPSFLSAISSPGLSAGSSPAMGQGRHRC
jgi:hypothetical protein